MILCLAAIVPRLYYKVDEIDKRVVQQGTAITEQQGMLRSLARKFLKHEKRIAS